MLIRSPVVAIGLDSLDPGLGQSWLDIGHLPHLRRLRDGGAHVRLRSTDSETAWTTFLTGVSPGKTGFASHFSFDRHSYGCAMPGTYDYRDYPPFYAAGDAFRVAAIDIPQVRLAKNVNGIQVLSYGAHAPFTARVSEPADLLPRLIRSYGDHPAADGRDYARFWRRSSMETLVRRLRVGAGRRAAICRDLLRSEPWDLFLAVFGEIHSVSHYLWHTARPDHPLHEHFGRSFDADQMLAVATAVDAGLGEILSAAPSGAYILAFSQEGMVRNVGDMPGAVFLPELLYRYSFPGERGIDPNPGDRPGQNEPPPPPIVRPGSRAWHRKTWALKHDSNRLRRFLRRNLPIEFGWMLEKIMGAPPGPGHPWDFEVKYQPAVWYSPFWPRMKAFALPTASQQGKIRVNLRGREAEGIVGPEAYAAVCEEITQHLHALRDARTGEPLVREVVREHDVAPVSDPDRSFADLLVHWQPQPTDVIDSPTFGRFGPVQYMRTGGHVEDGFLIAAGPGIAEGSRLADGHVRDLAPTILSLMGAALPDHLEGRPLLGPLGATPKEVRQALTSSL